MSSPLDTRPRLDPTPSASVSRLRSSSSRSRSRSPVRRIRDLLGKATPPVRFVNASHHDGLVEPAMVATLRRSLVKDATCAVIPIELHDDIAAVDPTEFDQIPSFAFCVDLTYASIPLPAVWKSVRAVHKEARACEELQKDENAWVDVVKNVFDLALSIFHNRRIPRQDHNEDEKCVFTINTIQTQSIDPSYLTPPIPAKSLSFAKKTDLAVAFDPEDERVKALRSLCPSFTTLSHMSDLYTSTVPLVSAVEVKRYGGDTAEAELQLGTWQAAALAHFHCMFVGQDGRISTSLPQIGWSVIGHTWAFHIAWKDGVRGPTTIRGPFLPGAGSTATYHGIFTLLSLLCNMFDWLLDTYWPEFARCVSASYVPTT